MYRHYSSGSNELPVGISSPAGRVPFIFPNGDTIEGTFQITNYQRKGEVEGVETYSMTLESSGIPTFTAA